MKREKKIEKIMCYAMSEKEPTPSVMIMYHIDQDTGKVVVTSVSKLEVSDDIIIQAVYGKKDVDAVIPDEKIYEAAKLKYPEIWANENTDQ